MTEDEVKCPKLKDESLQKASNPEERHRKRSGHAEEIIGSNLCENASACTARSLTPLRQRSPAPRRSPSPLQRRDTPVKRRWSRTRDAKFSHASRRSEDVVVAEVRAYVDKQTAGARQRATNDPGFEEALEGR